MPTHTIRRRPAPDCPTIFVCHASDVPDARYVGRAWAGRAASPLGNPFATGEDRIGRFNKWLRDAYSAFYAGTATAAQYTAMLELLDLAEHYREHGTLELGCWCAPAECHADIVARAVFAVVKQQPRMVKFADGWATVHYDEELAAEGLPFVAHRDGRAVRAGATHRELREAAAGQRAFQVLADDVQVERVNGAGIEEEVAV